MSKLIWIAPMLGFISLIVWWPKILDKLIETRLRGVLVAIDPIVSRTRCWFKKRKPKDPIQPPSGLSPRARKRFVETAERLRDNHPPCG